ncbi:DUF4931 domain-containing protein [Candidatus Woesebacteria bacterium]|nr:DUF4931 domain-containing protein [Candidatus Woesebacteria bacterium]
MTKYVPDISSRRWVIVSAQRAARPDQNGKEKSKGEKKVVCVFCPGNEKLTSEEVYRVGEGERNEKGWKVRVILNKFPITDLHEVVIHSPSDTEDLFEYSQSQVESILHAYRDRFNFYRKRGQVLIFCNHGEHAGASIKHPHSQIVVLPPQINLDSLTREPKNNLVDEDEVFSVYCPDFSQWPYEVWITPKEESKSFFGDITDKDLPELARIMKRTIKRLHDLYDEGNFHVPFGYNYYISPKENWYLRIIPRFVHRAGFELGTGLSVNEIDPLNAALGFKGVDEKVSNIMSKLKSKM